MQEVWDYIPGFKQYYEVSTYGGIRRLRREIIRRDGQYQIIGARDVTQRLDRLGYVRVDIQIDGIKKCLLLHRLIAKTFIPNNTPERVEVNHIDGNKQNNRVSNLEWCTRGENMQHASHMGLMVGISGSDNRRSVPVDMFDSTTGLYLYTFHAIHEAARYLGSKSYATKICACCTGRRKSAYGYLWKYTNITKTVTTTKNFGE